MAKPSEKPADKSSKKPASSVPEISIATAQDENDAAVSIAITTGIGQRYQLSIKPKNGRPVLLAVHL